jgi:hypothetical protein
MRQQVLKMATCNWGMATYCKIISVKRYFLTADELTLMHEAMDAFLYMYSELGRDQAGTEYWHITPKFHMFQHIVLDAMNDKVNPGRFQCFVNEDMVGKGLSMAMACHSQTVGTTAAERYRLLLIGLWKRMIW